MTKTFAIDAEHRCRLGFQRAETERDGEDDANSAKHYYRVGDSVSADVRAFAKTARRGRNKRGGIPATAPGHVSTEQQQQHVPFRRRERRATTGRIARRAADRYRDRRRCAGLDS